MGGDSWDKKLCPELPVPLPILLVCLDVDVTLVFAQHLLDTTKKIPFPGLEGSVTKRHFFGLVQLLSCLDMATQKHKKSQPALPDCHTRDFDVWQIGHKNSP